MADLESELRPLAESLVAEHAAGGELLGACVATQQKTFSGWMVAIAVTPERLILQRVAKGLPFAAEGQPTVLTATEIATAKASGAGGEWWNATAPIMDMAAVRLELKTTGGERIKLMLMRGEGAVLGKLGGGEIQRSGVQALGEWFARNAPA